MNNHIAEVHHHPTFVRLSLDTASPLVLFVDGLLHRFRQRVQHAAAGAGADHEIIGKGCDFLDIDQQDIFTLFIFQGFYNGTSQVKCVQ